MSNLYVGLMSGTSMDAVNAVLVDFSESTPRTLATYKKEIPIELKKGLQTLCSPSVNEINRLGQADRQVANLFSNAVNELLTLAQKKPHDIAAIGSHGQTIRHMPDADLPFTLQIGDPNSIAINTGIKVVADFRRADIAVGGQGAPLTPAFHSEFFNSNDEDRMIVNIGGIANVTLLGNKIMGFDIGPGNCLLDAIAQKYLAKDFDDDGEFGKSGTVDTILLEQLLRDPYFTKMPPKSSGKEYFNLDWLNANQQPENIQATLVELTATLIKNHQPPTTKMFICGGGIRNKFLMERIEALCQPNSVYSTEALGLDPDWVEAIAFAWLAKKRLLSEAIDFSSITGSEKPVLLGGVYSS